mgnify:CR=1 FL=1
MKNSSLNGVGVKHLHIMDDKSVCILYFFLWDTTSGTYYMIQFWVGFEVSLMSTELSSYMYQVILPFHTCKLFCLVLNMHRQGCVVFKYSGSPLYCPRYIATLAYRHEIVKNALPPMLIPPL